MDIQPDRTSQGVHPSGRVPDTQATGYLGSRVNQMSISCRLARVCSFLEITTAQFACNLLRDTFLHCVDDLGNRWTNLTHTGGPSHNMWHTMNGSFANTY